MPYEMTQKEVAECLGITQSAVSQWQLPRLTIPAVLAECQRRGRPVDAIWLHAVRKLDEFADAEGASTQVNDLANALIDNPDTPIPDRILREVVAAARAKARLDQDRQRLRATDIEWVKRGDLEDALIRVVRDADLAFGAELLSRLTRAGVSARRARDLAEVLDKRVYGWIDEIARAAHYDLTNDGDSRPTEFSTNGHAGPAAMEAKGRPAP